MRAQIRPDVHSWSQRHLSHYVDGDLGHIAMRRLERHARDCPECSRGIRALRSLARLLHTALADVSGPAPSTIFDKVRKDAAASGASHSGNTS